MLLMKAKKERVMLSQAKCALVELLLSYEEGDVIKKSNINTIFNGILYPRVKQLNKERVKKMTKYLKD